MSKIYSVKLGDSDQELIDWLNRQQDSPSALLRRALILLMNSSGGRGGKAPSPSTPPDGRLYDLLDRLNTTLEALPGALAQQMVQPPPMWENPPANTKANRPAKVVVPPPEPENDPGALVAATDEFLNMFG